MEHHRQVCKCLGGRLLGVCEYLVARGWKGRQSTIAHCVAASANFSVVVLVSRVESLYKYVLEQVQVLEQVVG